MTDIREELARAMLESLKAQMQLVPGDAGGAFSCDAGTIDLGQVADALLPIIQRVRAEERERCAKVADEYADNPVGDERQETLKAFNVGMTYRTGGCDNGSAIAAAIRALT